jgi:hypothetical protein
MRTAAGYSGHESVNATLVTPSFARPTRLSHGVAELVQVPVTPRNAEVGQDERLFRTLPVTQYAYPMLSLSVWCRDTIATSCSG